ncbi:hypothetical protein Tco_1054710 [Tanacetum coccineum]|uniref:Lectin n=1 Tax=Tanacetum coccineum TaxID=301880 RepID=A0ABQ5GXK4_9ASTR
MSVYNSEHNSPINSDHDDDVHDPVTRISKFDISDPLHLHPNNTTALTVVSIKLKGTENYQLYLSRETWPDVRSAYATISSKESHRVAVGSGFSTWMAYGGNTRDLGSFGEETDEITDLNQILKEVLFTEHGDSVTSIKRCRRDLFSDGVWNLKTASGRGRLKEDLESST